MDSLSLLATALSWTTEEPVGPCSTMSGQSRAPLYGVIFERAPLRYEGIGYFCQRGIQWLRSSIPFTSHIAVQWRPQCAIASTLPKRCCASARIYPTLTGSGRKSDQNRPHLRISEVRADRPLRKLIENVKPPLAVA